MPVGPDFVRPFPKQCRDAGADHDKVQNSKYAAGMSRSHTVVSDSSGFVLQGTDAEVASYGRLITAHASLAALATRVAGTTLDADKRAEAYFEIYQESAGNFAFPLVACHGSMWGVTHTQRIERQLQRLVPLSRHGRLQRWIDALDDVRNVNRRVFIEIFTTFHFTRHYGRHPRAMEFVEKEILPLYNLIHDAVEYGELLPFADRRRIYRDIFEHEQHHIVDPGIRAAAKATQSPWLVRVLKRVTPRFRYFPRHERLYFTDFTSVEQRNREGLRAMEFAEEVGAARVYEALSEY